MVQAGSLGVNVALRGVYIRHIHAQSHLGHGKPGFSDSGLEVWKALVIKVRPLDIIALFLQYLV